MHFQKLELALKKRVVALQKNERRENSMTQAGTMGPRNESSSAENPLHRGGRTQAQTTLSWPTCGFEGIVALQSPGSL